LRRRSVVAVELTQCSPRNRGGRNASVGIRQQSCPIRNPQKQEGKRAMARMNFGYLPKGNPCAQCGKPIATPEWIESGPQRTSYLWHCFACDYQFEAVAFFEDEGSEALAA
jgi:hypothetical protein